MICLVLQTIPEMQWEDTTLHILKVKVENGMSLMILMLRKLAAIQLFRQNPMFFSIEKNSQSIIYTYLNERQHESGFNNRNVKWIATKL